MQALRIAALTFALGLAATAHAKMDAKPDKEGALVQLDVKEPITDQLARVERAISSEHYSEIGLEQKSRVQQALNRIRLKVGDQETVEQLNPQARTDVFNDQELVNNILTRAHADSRMVCRRERSTGSNRPQEVCMTVAQRRAASENGRETLRRTNSNNNFRPL